MLKELNEIISSARKEISHFQINLIWKDYLVIVILEVYLRDLFTFPIHLRIKKN